jgi:purine-binding chemotaxis protein CheW
MEEHKALNLHEAQESADLAGKYLTFALGQEEYGIGILKIKEIIGMMTITAMPQTPPYIKGVINLRGKVIPITDLRMKFGLDNTGYTERTCIIVVEINYASRPLLMGLVVDGVSEVANIKGGEIEGTPDFGTGKQASFIKGMAKIAGGVKILLDIDTILTGEQLLCLEELH